MNWPRIALVALLVLAALGFGVPWATGIDSDEWPLSLRLAFVGAILLAMIVLGRDQMRQDKEAETWIDDPQRTKLQNWIEKRRQRFSPKRGIEFFLAGLVVFSIMVGISALSGELVSMSRGVVFVLAFSLLAGLFGIFTEKVPF